MSDVLYRFRPAIVLEVGDFAVPGASLSGALVSLLASRGYRPFEHRSGDLVPRVPRETYGYENLLFLPA